MYYPTLSSSAPALSNYVSGCHTLHQREGRPFAYPTETRSIFPGPEIVVLLEGGWQVSHSSRPTALPQHVVSQQLFESGQIVATQRQASAFVIRFKPSGLFQLVGVPFFPLVGSWKRLEDLWPRQRERFALALRHCATDAEHQLFAEHFFQEQAARPLQVEDYVHQAVERIIETNGMSPIRDIAGNLRVSQRQLERKFLERTGIPPKYFARLIRADYTFHQIRNNPLKPITEIVTGAGFYDLSHFNKDFHMLTGRQLRELITRRSNH